MRWVAVFLLVACNPSKDTRDAPPPNTASPTASVARSAQATGYQASELPVAADFEQAADETIDSKNYQHELDAITKDVGDVPDGTAPTDTAD
jgi:hypothetical protein